jgi:hypothetical protein
MKIVFIAHPIAARSYSDNTLYTVQDHVEDIIDIIRDINLTMPDIIPFAPYIADVIALDDANEEQRDRGIKNSMELFERKVFDEVWVYGKELSTGVRNEIEKAMELGIPVLFKCEYDIHFLEFSNSKKWLNKKVEVKLKNK